MSGLEMSAVDCGHPRRERTIAFAQQCFWKAGPYLANTMRENVVLPWERVAAACGDGRVICFCTFTEKDELPEEHGYSPFIGFVFVDGGSRGRRVSEKLISRAAEYTASNEG